MGVRTWLVNQGVGINFFSTSRNPKVRAAVAAKVEQYKLSRMHPVDKYLYLVSQAGTLADAIKVMTDVKVIPKKYYLPPIQIGIQPAWESILTRFSSELRTTEGIRTALVGTRFFAGHYDPTSSENLVRAAILKLAEKFAPELLLGEQRYIHEEMEKTYPYDGYSVARMVYHSFMREASFIRQLLDQPAQT